MARKRYTTEEIIRNPRGQGGPDQTPGETPKT